MIKRIRKTVNLLNQFSIPLIGGVLFALVWANFNNETYLHFLEHPFLGEATNIFGHTVNFHFLINDIFMVFFFGIAAVEITQSALPGGALNPIKRAINPLLGTIGGVLGPVIVYLTLTTLLGRSDAYNGWGIPTATDIAVSWLIARTVFGAKHPAVSFLLLLAVADDGIGLVIIAVFYPDPRFPVEIQWLGLTLLGMVVAFIVRRFKVRNFLAYIIPGGLLSWTGLMLAHLHPALALVFIIPFLPHAREENHELFEEEQADHSALMQFEHTFKFMVDVGLFGFGLANAGVQFAGITEITWVVFLSLAVGKTMGISLMSGIASKIGLPLPEGMNYRTLIMAALVAAVGLTVALFVAGEAFRDPALQGAAKMGAVFSGLIGFPAIVLGRMLKIKRIN